MSPRGRLIVFLVAVAVVAPLLAWGLHGLPDFGHYAGPYGDVLNRVAIGERHVTNVVTAVNFDYRGMDTLGEEYIFFAAITGLGLILRHMRGEPARTRQAQGRFEETTDAVRWLGLFLTGIIVVFGIYIVIHAQLTPGGGFQGGALLGTAALLVYLVTDFKTFHRVSPRLMLDLSDSAGAGGYAAIGVATLLAGGAFLENLLPLGQTGSLLSSGTIALINLAVGLEVAAGFVLLFKEFVEQEEEDSEVRR